MANTTDVEDMLRLYVSSQASDFRWSDNGTRLIWDMYEFESLDSTALEKELVLEKHTEDEYNSLIDAIVDVDFTDVVGAFGDGTMEVVSCKSFTSYRELCGFYAILKVNGVYVTMCGNDDISPNAWAPKNTRIGVEAAYSSSLERAKAYVFTRV